jgi:hypothetical protein
MFTFPQIPIIWDRFLDEATKEFNNSTARETHDAAMTKYHQQLKVWEDWGREQTAEPSTAQNKRRKTNENAPKKPVKPPTPRLRMHKDEPTNFLRLATALKLFLNREVTDQTIDRGSMLYQDYLFGFKQVRLTALL